MDRTELKYLQEAPEGYEPPISVKSCGRKHQLQEVLRIYAGDIEVETPFGFDVEVDRARGKRGLYPLKASSVDDQSTRRGACEAVPECKLARRFGPEIRLSIRIASDNVRYIL